MDFDNVKENIQPLASGRNASILHASLRADATQELREQRRQLEHDIHNYNGDDPLDPWFTYIQWIEQSCPSGGKESGMQEVLVKCLTRFEEDVRYQQDERMIKLYIKFISGLKEPLEKYEVLFKAGFGTMVADFYIAWAYVADQHGNTRKADEIFRRGLQCRAQPLEVLEEAHQHFRFYVGQRLMYKDDVEARDEADRQLNERRLALTTLRGHRRKANVGSIRTGAAVKSLAPGIVACTASTSSKSNAQINVYCAENVDPNAVAAAPALEEHISPVRMLIEAARDQENAKEPGPWNKAHDKKHAGKLFGKKTHLDFDIHEDDSSVFTPILPRTDIPAFKYPPHFVSKNRTQVPWLTPVTTENEPEARAFPQYNKCLLYPRPNMEFQPEELRAYYHFKRRGQQNAFTVARDPYWSVGDVDAPVRQYPNFAKKSLPQQRDALDTYFRPPELKGLVICFNRQYADSEEYQCEELLWRRRKQRLLDTQFSDDAMEETMCATSERVLSRKSFFPRKSVVPSLLPSVEETEQTEGTSIMAKLLEAPQELVEQPDTEPVVSLPFEIYEDPTRTKVPIPLAKSVSAERTPSPERAQLLERENLDPGQFSFKAPLPPAKSNKLPFEIYTEDEAAPTATPPAPAQLEMGVKSPASAGFDAEETCNTQQFNIFLKSQTQMSTPKMQQKLAPSFARLAETLQPEATVPEPIPVVAEDAKATPSSPQTYFKNLSTILETSEHAISHTTAASRTNTKSSCVSSPELEGLDAHVSSNKLQTVQEQSMEQHTSQLCATPAAPRQQTEKCEVGNFTRLEQREDTAQLCGMRFQEDKTETLPNVLQRTVKFQDDKTETFSKLLMPQAMSTRFQEDKTDTFSKLIIAPALPAQSPEKCELLKSYATPELKLSMTPPIREGKTKSGNPNSTANLLLKDSMLQLDTTPAAFNKKPGLKLRDSFVPEFSYIAETQPKAAEESFMPECSYIAETQPKPTENSFMPQLSLLEQKNEQEPAAVKAKTMESSLAELSLVAPSQAPTTELRWKQNKSTESKQHMLPESFLKDFSAVSVPHPLTESKLNFGNCSTLKFMDESASKPPAVQKEVSKPKAANSSIQFLKEPNDVRLSQAPAASYFEPNVETAMFNANNSMIKNSTWLPRHDPLQQQQQYIQDTSVHIKEEVLEAEEDAGPLAADELSIYYKQTPKTPKEARHAWLKSTPTPHGNQYLHVSVDLMRTQQVIQDHCANEDVNPFSVELTNAFLDDIAFSEYVANLPTCQLQHRISRLAAKQVLCVHAQQFEVIKLVGEGAYGSVYSGKHLQTGKKVALKQEQPPNCWEYYICLEIQSRLKVDDLLAAYMSADYALIGKNSSVLISSFSPHGSLIQVCNKVKKNTNKHVDEYVVMHMTREILEIIDHLHSIHIIHADIKPDNFLLTNL